MSSGTDREHRGEGAWWARRYSAPMRTVRAGIAAGRRTPMAFAPYCAEAALAALLVLTGALPAASASAPVTGILPVGIYHDVKQSLAFGVDWSWVAAAVGVGVVVRSMVFAATLWLSEGGHGPFIAGWARTARVALIAAVAFLPVAGLHFAGAAIRYAPFTWIAGAMGVVAAIFVTRIALRLDVGDGRARGRGVPAVGAMLTYAYFFSLASFGVWMLSGSGPWATALILLCLGPVNAAVVLGWRDQVRSVAPAEPGTSVLAVTALAVLALFGASAYDRYIADPAPVRDVRSDLTLFILGGVDSSSESGALFHFDPRSVGVARNKTRHLSYRANGPYTMLDTHRDPVEIARAVARQIAEVDGRRAVLGHSQSALMIDRLLDSGAARLDQEISISGSPPYAPFWPPTLNLPRPGDPGPGKPGADAARAYAALFETIGLQSFDIDAPVSPTTLEPVVPCTSRCSIPRMNVWALGDSVWLDRDWRRPGEVNIIVVSDHVGAVGNARTLDAARAFLARRSVPSDEGSSWQGALVHVLRFAFEPWRPGR